MTDFLSTSRDNAFLMSKKTNGENIKIVTIGFFLCFGFEIWEQHHPYIYIYIYIYMCDKKG